MKRIRSILTCVILFFTSLCVWSQDKARVQALEQTLAQISEYHEVNFNYDKGVIEGFQTSDIDITQNLPNLLAALARQTGLRYRYLETNVISVSKTEALTLCGYLKDKETLFAVEGATLQTRAASVSSNQEGYFEIKIENIKELVTIRHLGYKTIVRPYEYFKKEGCEALYLVANERQLPQIVLQGFLVRGIDTQDDGAVSLDFRRFSILPGVIDADVLQSIQALPGISSINETVSDVNIRGGTHDQNLILWDNIKMYQSGHFFGLISVFNPQMNQKVTLIKNGTPSHYTDGVSGTISMQTKEQITTEFTANMGVNLINADLFADVPLSKNSSLQIAGRKSLSDFVKTPTYEAYFDRISQDTELATNTGNASNSNQEFDFYDSSLRYVHQISERDVLRLNFLVIYNKLLFTESAEVNEVSTSRQSEVSQNSIAAGLYYGHKWSDAWESNIQVYNTDYMLQGINANVEFEQRFLQENSVSETGAKLQNSYLLSDKIKAGAGYQFIETKVTNLDDVDNPIFRSLNGEVIRSHGGFLDGVYHDKTSKSRIQLGGRYTYLPKFSKHIIEPRLSVSQGFLSYFTAQLLGEFKHQTTSQIINFQNDFLGIEKRRWQLSNDGSIPVITSKQISLGLSFNQDSWLLNAEGFYKQVEGITTQSQGFRNQFEFAREVGSYEATGIDFLLRKNLGRLNLWGSFSYLTSDYTFDTLSTTNFANNYSITHSASFGTTYDHKALKLALGLNYRSGRPTTPIDSENPIILGGINYQLPNSENLEYYLRLDASAMYTISFEDSKLQIAASVWNLLDKENTLDRYYAFNAEQTGVGLQEQHSLGLTPNVSLRYFF